MNPNIPMSLPCAPRIPSRDSREAFTLIELLTVIAIIGILAAIIIPTVGQVRESARTAQCISNLRQMGVAMALATEDRKGVLPGPFQTGQGTPCKDAPMLTEYAAYDPDSSTFTEDQGKNLTVRLGPYMDLSPLNGGKRRTSLFVCPAYGLKYTGPSYILPLGVDYTKGTSIVGTQDGYVRDMMYPFGYPGTTSPERKVKTLSTMQNLSIPASRLWAISDCFVNLPGKVVTGWEQNCPLDPIHGKYGNALYFDWHVGKIDSTGPVK